MKLCLDEDEESRPDSLTPNFLSLLMITENKKKGIFQLLSFKKKKDAVYSTKISDGFFETKLMMVQEAAKQLSQGQVKQLSILEGWVRNHGDGMLIVREAVRHWSSHRKVGLPLPWKPKRQNVNNSGSSLIDWSKEEFPHPKIEAPNQNNPVQSGEILYLQASDKKVEKPIQKVEMTETVSLKQMTQTQSLLGAGLEPFPKSEERVSLQEGTEKEKVQCSTFLPVSKNPSKTESKSEQLSERMDQIMAFLFQSDEQQSNLERQTVKPEDKQRLLEQAVQQTEDYQERLGCRSEPRVDLNFIFRALSEEEDDEEKTWKKKEEGEGGESDDEVFLEWLNRKKVSKSQNNKVHTPMPSSVLKRRQEMYMQLMSSPDDEEKSLPKPSPTSPCLHSTTATKQQLEDLQYLNLQNIYHGIYPKNSSNWYTLGFLRCIGQPTNKDYANAIVADESNELLINVVFANWSTLTQQLQEGCLYRFGGGLIKPTPQSQWNRSHCEIQFDCSKSLIEQMPSQLRATETSSNYVPIEAIYSRDEGKTVNLFGIVKSLRSISAKNGVISNYELIDPINRYGITLTQFDSSLSSEAIPTYLSQPITVYNANIGCYKGKKNIVTRPKTIIKHLWLPPTEEAQQLRQWLDANSQSLDNIELNLVGFTQCLLLSQIQSIPDSQIFLRNVTIFSINPKYTYLACVKCLKKVQEGRCRTCGKRAPHETVERLFVRGSIGDASGVLSILWSSAIAQPILSIGFHEFEGKWLLKKASVWLQRGSNDNLTMVKLQCLQVSKRIENLFDFVKGRIL